MSMLGGRRRHLGSDRWIRYTIFYGDRDDGRTVEYVAFLHDDVGVCPETPEGCVYVIPGASIDETARAAVCHFIDTEPIGPGKPSDPGWPRIGRGGRLLI